MFNNTYQLDPIDDWGMSLSLSDIFGLYAQKVKQEVVDTVLSLSGEHPNIIRCGIIGNPDTYDFEPIIYAKIDNNGTVYAFTNADLDEYHSCKLRGKNEEVYNNLPF